MNHPKRYVAFSFLLNGKGTSSLSIFHVYSIEYRFHELAFLACLLLIVTHIHELNKYISLLVYLNLLTLQNALFPLFSAGYPFFPPVQNQNVLLSIHLKNRIDCISRFLIFEYIHKKHLKNGMLFSHISIKKNRIRKFSYFLHGSFAFSYSFRFFCTPLKTDLLISLLFMILPH